MQRPCFSPFLIRIRVGSARRPTTARHGHKTGSVQTAALCELPSNLGQHALLFTSTRVWVRQHEAAAIHIRTITQNSMFCVQFYNFLWTHSLASAIYNAYCTYREKMNFNWCLWMCALFPFAWAQLIAIGFKLTFESGRNGLLHVEAEQVYSTDIILVASDITCLQFLVWTKRGQVSVILFTSNLHSVKSMYSKFFQAPLISVGGDTTAGGNCKWQLQGAYFTFVQRTSVFWPFCF